MIEDFKQLYNILNKDNVDRIGQLYSDDVVFSDPFHKVIGLNALKEYFRGLYQNVESIEFHFNKTFEKNADEKEAKKNESEYCVDWTMHLKHPKLNAGKSFTVPGVTFLTINADGMITKHQDYFDAGVMLYEKIPLIGKIIRFIKGRL